MAGCLLVLYNTAAILTLLTLTNAEYGQYSVLKKSIWQKVLSRKLFRLIILQVSVLAFC
jgi:hypothetical protein